MDDKEKIKDSAEGHRDRVISSIMERGYGSLADYQLLEALLFYSIPRKDVKPIAKRLLSKFSTLENVLSADPYALKEIDGVGNKTAVFLNLIYAASERIRDNRCAEYTKINDFGTAIKYFTEMYYLDNEIERFAGMFLDSSGRIKKCCFISDGTADSVSVNIRKFMELALETKAASVIIAHNHPGGEAFPSCEDVNFTINLMNVLENIGVYLADHIIINGSEGFSMHSSINFVEIFERKGNSRNNPDSFCT